MFTFDFYDLEQLKINNTNILLNIKNLCSLLLNYVTYIYYLLIIVFF